MDEETRPKILTAIVCLIISVSGTYLCLAYLADSAFLFSDEVFVLWAFFILVFFIWMFFHAALHELGHIIFGKLSGYGFLGTSVFGIWLLKDMNGKMRLRYLPIKGAGGATMMLPKDGYKDDTPYAAFLMGGVLMNVLTVISLIALIILNIWESMNFFIGTAAMLGAVLAAANSVPAVYGNLVNDAAMLRLFRKDGASKHCMHFMQRMFFDHLNGADLAPFLDRVPSVLPAGNRLADCVRINAAELMIQRNMTDAAERYLLDLLNDLKIDGIMMRMTKLYLLFIYAVNGTDKGTIDALYDDKMRAFVNSQALMNLTAMVFLAAYEKRFNAGDADVDKIVKRFNAAVKKSKFDTTFERNAMDAVLSEQWDFLPKIN